MSDNYLNLVPKDPFHVPMAGARDSALGLAREMFPDAEHYEWNVYPTVHFIDCGENLEEILCPACDSRLTLNYFSEDDPVRKWWDTVFLDVNFCDGANCFDIRRDDTVATPCCGRVVRILDLRFNWPAAFGRCELSIMNPDASGPLDPGVIARFQAAAGCELVQVWAHY